MSATKRRCYGLIRNKQFEWNQFIAATTVQLDPPFAQTNNSAITGRNRRKESKRISSHQLPIADVAVDAAAQNIRNRKSSATTETVMCCRIHNMNSGGCTVKLYKSGDEHDRRVTDSGRYRDR